MMTNPVGSLNMITSAGNWMKSADALRALSFKGNANSLGCEKKLIADMYNDKLAYTAGDYMEQSAKSVRNQNIKRSFSIFA